MTKKTAGKTDKAIALYLSGNLKAAEKIYKKILKSDGNNHNVLRLLGVLENRRGRKGVARKLIKKAIRINPDIPAYYNNLGEVYRSEGKYQSAIENYSKAIYLNGEYAQAYNNLGCSLAELDKLDDAVDSFNKAVMIDNNYSDAYSNLGNVLLDKGRVSEAIAVYNKAINSNPGNKYAFNGLGSALSDQGNFPDAVASYRKAIDIDPEYAEAYRHLLNNSRHTGYDDDIKAAELLYAKKNISDDQRMHLAFGLGRAYEDLGKYEESMEFILEANHLMHLSVEYSTSDARKLFNKIIGVFSEEFFVNHRGSGVSDETPIFILGMPRSGTSLVEQILATHSEVFGAGELNELSRLINNICLNHRVDRFPECASNFGNMELVEIGGRYIEKLREYSTDSKYITDKMPHNFMRIGLIKAVIPNAKIIHCTRDPMDNCLSIFKNFFPKGHNYSYDMVELGEYYNLYIELMKYWDSVLPGFIYTVNYENLVVDQENQIRMMLDYCGLSWDESCMHFHKTERRVGTASNVQVRRPIYKDSVHLWKRYERQLEPMRRAIYGD